MVKISDIAEKADVSITSVSLVLNGKEGVGKKTREKILKIAEELNYKKQPVTHRSEKKGDIRFLKVINHGHTINRDHNVFLADYIEGLSNISQNRSYNLEISTSNKGSLQQTVNALNTDPIDGLIVLGTELARSDIDLFSDMATPVIFIDTYYPNKSFDFVDMDNYSAVYQIVETMIKMNHKKVGLVTTEVETENFRQRETAFLHATEEFLNEKTMTFTVDSTYDGSYKDFSTIINSNNILPTALFCVNDIIALGCMKAILEKNIAIPEDISIIGFDNLPQSTTSTPPLTTIDVEKCKIGEQAMNMLIDRIESDTPIPKMKVSIGNHMILRDSIRKL